LFKKGMNRRLPAIFKHGARIAVLASRAELASPSRPLLRPELEIVWVHGLTVDGQDIFGLSTLLAWEKENRLWGYALLAAAICAVTYFGYKWRRAKFTPETQGDGGMLGLIAAIGTGLPAIALSFWIALSTFWWCPEGGCPLVTASEKLHLLANVGGVCVLLV